MSWWFNKNKVTRKEFEELQRKVNNMAIKVSELAGALTVVNDRLTKIQGEVQALKEALSNTEIPADAQTALDNLNSLTKNIDDINPDA